MPEQTSSLQIGKDRRSEDTSPMTSCHNWKIDNCEVTNCDAGGIAVNGLFNKKTQIVVLLVLLFIKLSKRCKR